MSYLITYSSKSGNCLYRSPKANSEEIKIMTTNTKALDVDKSLVPLVLETASVIRKSFDTFSVITKQGQYLLNENNEQVLEKRVWIRGRGAGFSIVICSEPSCEISKDVDDDTDGS